MGTLSQEQLNVLFLAVRDNGGVARIMFFGFNRDTIWEPLVADGYVIELPDDEQAHATLYRDATVTEKGLQALDAVEVNAVAVFFADQETPYILRRPKDFARDAKSGVIGDALAEAVEEYDAGSTAVFEVRIHRTTMLQLALLPMWEPV